MNRPFPSGKTSEFAMTISSLSLATLFLAEGAAPAAGAPGAGAGTMQFLFIGLMFAAMYFLVIAPLEMLVPLYAERAHPTSWHPHHIAERYGLFTIIVLGETIAAATVAVKSSLDEHDALGELRHQYCKPVLLYLHVRPGYTDARLDISERALVLLREMIDACGQLAQLLRAIDFDSVVRIRSGTKLRRIARLCERRKIGPYQPRGDERAADREQDEDRGEAGGDAGHRGVPKVADREAVAPRHVAGDDRAEDECDLVRPPGGCVPEEEVGEAEKQDQCRHGRERSGDAGRLRRGGAAAAAEHAGCPRR